MATIVTVWVVLALQISFSLKVELKNIPKPEPSFQFANSKIIEKSEEAENKHQYYRSWTYKAKIGVPSEQIKLINLLVDRKSAGRVPVYIPPVKPSGTIKVTDTKFSDDGPVWDQIPAKEFGPTVRPIQRVAQKPTTQTPRVHKEASPVPNNTEKSSVPAETLGSTTVRPTRPTRRPGQKPVTYPPLVHKDESRVPETAEKSSGSAIGTFQPSEGKSSRPQAKGSTELPKETPVLTNQMSTCVWAIISCCAANSEHVSYDCFEVLGCTGAFWGSSPCESEFARSAVLAATNYYNNN